MCFWRIEHDMRQDLFGVMGDCLMRREQLTSERYPDVHE